MIHPETMYDLALTRQQDLHNAAAARHAAKQVHVSGENPLRVFGKRLMALGKQVGDIEVVAQPLAASR